MTNPKQSAKLRPDVAETAFLVMREAVGDTPKTDPEKREKNPDAVARGSKGGKKGGKARAAKLTPEQRKEAGRKAASQRWSAKPASE